MPSSQHYFIKEEVVETPANSFEEESQEFKTVEDRYPEEEDKAEKEKIEIVLPAAEETLATEEKQTAEDTRQRRRTKNRSQSSCPRRCCRNPLTGISRKIRCAFDPTLELSGFKFPTLDLLKDYGGSSITIDEDELEDQ